MKRFRPVINVAKKFLLNPFFRSRFTFASYFEKLPLDDKSILLESFSGDEFTGAPFYLLKELCHNPAYSSYKKYVAVNGHAKSKVETLLSEQIGIDNLTVVVRHTPQYCKLLATAKYLINNVAFPSYWIKSPEQIYLQTWHGTPLKALGRSMLDSSNTIGNVQRNFMMSDFILCPSEYVNDKLRNDYMIAPFYTGSYVFEGYPQNSALMDSAQAEKLKKSLDVEGKRVVVYMPTWRGGNKSQRSIHSAYLNHVLCELESRLQDDVVVYAKPHHLASSRIDWGSFDRVLPFPEGYETYQILAMADVLVTDYSSVMFDFLAAGRTVLLYTYDEEEYQATRSMYRTVSSLPFWHTDNTTDLCREINSVIDHPKQRYEDCSNEFAPYDDAESSKRLCELLIHGKRDNLKIIPGCNFHNDKKNLLIFGGNLLKNGITTSLRALLRNIDSTKYNVTLLFYGGRVKANLDVINELPDTIGFIPIQGQQTMTFGESFAQYFYFRWDIKTAGIEQSLSKLYAREVKRLFPSYSFDSVVHFTGYERQIIHLLDELQSSKKVIYVHNDMFEEARAGKSFHLNSLNYGYKHFDMIAVVRESLKEKIARDFSIPDQKIEVVHNCLDINSVVLKAHQPIQFDENTKSNTDMLNVRKIYEQHKGSILINIGRFSAEKGHLRLIEAFSRYAKSEEPESTLVIVGGYGPEYDKVLEAAEQHSDCNIVVIKSLSNPFPLLANSDALVLSSFYEGLPMVIFEALLLDTPIISTAISGPKEFLEKGYGKLVDDSTDGIFNGLKEFKLGDSDNHISFDAESFNQTAIQEFYHVVS